MRRRRARALVKKSVAGCEEYVNPWKIPSFDYHGPVCGHGGERTCDIYSVRGAVLPDPEKLLEEQGRVCGT